MSVFTFKSPKGANNETSVARRSFLYTLYYERGISVMVPTDPYSECWLAPNRTRSTKRMLELFYILRDGLVGTLCGDLVT